MSLLIVIAVKGQVSSKLNCSDLYFWALQGNVNHILTTLDSFPDNTLDQKQLDFKNKYFTRFRKGDESFDYRTKDTFMIAILKLYQHYWKNVLLHQVPLNVADSLLAENVTDYIWNCYLKKKEISKMKVKDEFTHYTKKILNERGFGVANGKTGSYFDLLVWAKENKVNYKAELPETKVKVKIVFMEEIVSMGWEEYATFGTYFPGGWATTEELYCVKSTYDLESESFKVSYVKHEGQHFADYKAYPKLSGADLEYRAKLVELCYAKESIYKLISFFIRNSSRERSDSHAFANSCVTRDLSNALFGENVKDIEQWKKIPVEKINEQSELLFKKNTKDLNEVGAVLKEFIK